MIALRPYQEKAVATALAHDNGILVLPTGAGKSLVIAGIVSALPGKTIILQPSREILESNYEKIQHFGFEDAKIFSASLGIKEIGKATFATIGTVISKVDLFRDVETVIIDECHLVSAKGGQYLDFIAAIKPKKIIGLTATPYRLHSNSFGSQIKMLTRTRPKVFKDIIHVTQTQELIENKFLCNPEFISTIDGENKRDMLRPNSNGSNFTDSSVQQYLQAININAHIIASVTEALAAGSKHILAFTESIADSGFVLRELENKGIAVATVSSETKNRERTQLIKDFKNGVIQVMVNVGVLTTGFDFPELDGLVIGRPTMSLALWFQMVGRCVRPHPNKKSASVYDICGNYNTFGNPLEMKLDRTGKLWDIYDPKGQRLTTRFLTAEPEHEETMAFGKYKGYRLADVPTDYLAWAVENMTNRAMVGKFQIELKRRELIESQSSALKELEAA